MTANKLRTIIRWAVLDFGVAIAFVSTVVPLKDVTSEVLIAELTSGAGIGFLVMLVRYVAFRIIAK